MLDTISIPDSQATTSLSPETPFDEIDQLPSDHDLSESEIHGLLTTGSLDKCIEEDVKPWKILSPTASDNLQKITRRLPKEAREMRMQLLKQTAKPDLAARRAVLKKINAIQGCEWYDLQSLGRWFSDTRKKRRAAIAKKMSPYGRFPLKLEQDLRYLLRDGRSEPSSDELATLARRECLLVECLLPWVAGMRATLEEESQSKKDMREKLHAWKSATSSTSLTQTLASLDTQTKEAPRNSPRAFARSEAATELFRTFSALRASSRPIIQKEGRTGTKPKSMPKLTIRIPPLASAAVERLPKTREEYLTWMEAHEGRLWSVFEATALQTPPSNEGF